jgi:hypothetical protein
VLPKKADYATRSQKAVRQKKVFIYQDQNQKLSRIINNQQKQQRLLTNESTNRINSLQNQLIIKNRRPQNTASSLAPIRI